MPKFEPVYWMPDIGNLIDYPFKIPCRYRTRFMRGRMPSSPEICSGSFIMSAGFEHLIELDVVFLNEFESLPP